MTRCPTFIVSIAGPWISISGAVLTSHSTVQRLTDFIWLGRARAYEETKCIRIARVLQALKHGLRHLDAWYKKLRPSSLDNYAQYLLVFPAITFYPTADADVQREFRYTRKLKSENDPACTSFLAQAIDGEHQLVVKFVDRYDEHAHQLLAGQGLAPTLLYCGNIWPNEAGNACRPLRMVVMDYVSDMCTLDAWLSASVEEHGQILDEVEKAVRVLHDHNYVHGDIRSPNILVGRTNDCVKIMLIDFDWSGKEGMVSYPYDLNDLIKWPEGVQNLGTIQKEHDLVMLDRLRNH
jgi:serine/threonine protein kinase